MYSIKRCERCYSQFDVKFKSAMVKRFCSFRCARIANPNRYMGGLELGRAWNRGQKGMQPWMNISGLCGNKKGYKPSPEATEKNRIAHLGKPAWNKGKPSTYCGAEKHWNWQGGKTTQREKARKSIAYKEWRSAVYARDNYSCIECGTKGTIQADHIKPWAKHPDLRYDVDNGRTLCILCHTKTPSYPAGFAKFITTQMAVNE